MCDGCQVLFQKSQLIARTEVTLRCPGCDKVVPNFDELGMTPGNPPEYAEAAFVASWLERECGQLGLRCEQVRGGENRGLFRWWIPGDPLPGCPAGWFLAVEYRPTFPGVVAVMAVANIPGIVAPEHQRALSAYLGGFALQLHLEQHGGGMPAGPTAPARWGARQLLELDRLPPGVFPALAERLIDATKAAAALPRAGATG